MNLHQDVDRYLAQRRGLGFNLNTTEYLLHQFTDWLTARGVTESFTINDAVAWACDPPGAAPVWRARRLTAVRPFAAYLNASGVNVPVIPSGLLPACTTRREPFIYSQPELDHLLTACPFYFPTPRVAATMSTIIGLLAATGLRIGEALRLTVPDLDPTEHVLLVRATKRPLDRLVPLDPTTTTALTDYLTLPERAATNPAPDGPIFVNDRGTRYRLETIEQHFHALIDALGLDQPGQPRPRLHDLRHTFATRHMITAYTRAGNPARVMTLLTTWLGHTSPEHTYWYLSAAPELLAAAAHRLEPDSTEGAPL